MPPNDEIAGMSFEIRHFPAFFCMSSSDLDVAYIARLARLDLTAEETALFQTQLAQVLEHAAKLARGQRRGRRTSRARLPDLRCPARG